MRVAFVTKFASIVAMAALLVLPPVAGAVLSGANGRIVYISGRGATDADAKPYLRIATGSFGIGLNIGPIATASGQHRHPTWAPDRTMIAYSLGGDIRTLDLTNPFAVPTNITNTPTVSEDRPAWSPDQTRIAYESEVSNASGQVDILVKTLAGGGTLNLTNTPAAGQIEGKPAWTPDSAEIYYHTGDPTVDNSLDIVKEPSTGGTVTRIAASAGANEFQPSLSPDGRQLCFTRGTGRGFNVTADVIVSLANGGGQQDLSDDAAEGNYNCTWSPNGIFVAYVTGLFSTGDLVMERGDDTSPFPIGLEASTGTFDGNPDWAPDGRPVCEAATVSTSFNQPVTVPLKCLDSGPFYERSQVQEFISDPPRNGTVGDIAQGDQEPSTVIYTPNAGFSGADTFQLGSFDQIAGFGEPRTVTINVAAPPPVPAVVISNLTVKPRRWKRGRKLPRISAIRTGAKIRWRLSEAASTRLTFQKLLPKKGGGKRIRRAGSLTIANSRAQLNTLAFQGRLNRRKTLRPGTYRVRGQATNGGGQASRAIFSKPFTIVRG